MIEHCVGTTGIAKLHIKFVSRKDLILRVEKERANGNSQRVN